MKSFLLLIKAKIETLPYFVILGLASFLVIVIYFIDYGIKIDLSFSIFYLFPIILVTWFINKQVGFIFCFICAFAWFCADISVNKYDLPWLNQWNALVRLGFFLIVTYLLSELKQSYEREKKLARTDGLTGAVNRQFFCQLLQKEINRSARYNHSFSLVYIDVDNFKVVNDTFGHNQGDYLLILIAKTIQKNIRQLDTLARLGGDEFALILVEINYEAARIVLNRLQQELLTMVEIEKWPISFSIGAITYQTFPKSVDQAIEQVDHLMYDVKNNGKNGIKHKIKNNL